MAATCHLHAGPTPAVDWISDSAGSFDVVLSGTGEGWSGTVSSPSGEWQLQSANIIDLSTLNSYGPQVMVENAGNATFEGQLPPQFLAPNPSATAPFNAATIGTYGGYSDYFKPAAPIHDGSSLVYGYLGELSDFGPYENWSGMSTISITSMPNPNNPSTWTWTAQYAAQGQNLTCPEPTTLSLLSLATLLVAGRFFRKRN